MTASNNQNIRRNYPILSMRSVVKKLMFVYEPNLLFICHHEYELRS